MRKRCLIIGLGQIGMGYDYNNDNDILTHAHAISSHPSFELVGGVDPSENRITLFAKKYRKPAYGTITSALRAAKADIIVVATPANTHFEIAKIILDNATPEAILCEKPLANNIGDAKAIVNMCKSADTTLYTNFIRRSEPGAIAIRENFFNQRVDTQFKGSFWYSKGLYNNGSHFINLSAFWLGQFKNSQLLQIDDIKKADPEPDFLINFERGSVVFQSLKDKNFSYYAAEFFCKSGRFLYEDGGKEIRLHLLEDSLSDTKSKKLKSEYELIPNDMKCYQWHVYDQIHRHYSGKKCNISMGEDALETAYAIDEIIRQF
ncbi:Gfo/Idh/MocA family protein [Lentilitoribacter sp. EG35]|uniref:Gfo/Idh/MocA family protein n=1 Tax=Lentilitoribacter sp. EG35 TaxID=3234192 RepID=UPI00345F3682